MDINISGHHIELTDSLRQGILEKLGHLSKFDFNLSSIDVILSIEKERHKITATANGPHMSLHAEAISDNMYTSIDELEQKLKTQISEHKKKLNDKKRHPNANKRDELDD